MSDRVFLDTNVLVYAFDRDEPKKRARALEVIDAVSIDRTPTISTQVLQEFYVTVTRKMKKPLGEEQAEEETRKLAQLPVAQVDPPMVIRAIQTSRRYQISLWDALILRAAAESGCKLILTEDLQDGFTMDGLRVENPFRELD